MNTTGNIRTISGIPTGDGGAEQMVNYRAEVKSKVRVGLLGVGLEADNMGVSALVESAVKCILKTWPQAEVVILGDDYECRQACLQVMGRDVPITTLPTRLSLNIFHQFHIVRLFFYAMLIQVFPLQAVRDFASAHNLCVRTILGTDLLMDVAAGDSFSDIYGLGRFFKRILRRWGWMLFGRKLILLPQTYGPFRSKPAKMIARIIMRRADLICTREQSGVEYVRQLIGDHYAADKVCFVPDMAFMLDGRRPAKMDIGSLENVRRPDSIVVGLNVSGLLFNGGYTGNNMFELRTDYRRLMFDIIDELMKDKRVLVILIPHVFALRGPTVENDSQACEAIYRGTNGRYSDRLFMARGTYDHGEIKHIIGMCDIFIGSRMHACVAAMSQYIPAIGLAYSDKFEGVFRSAAMEDLVVDLRRKGRDEIIDAIRRAIDIRAEWASRLKSAIPQVQAEVLKVFKGISDMRVADSGGNATQGGDKETI